MVRCPPGNVLCKIVFAEFLPLPSTTRCWSAGQSRIIGTTRSLLYASPNGLTFGCTTSTGPGSCVMMYPRKFRVTSVLPVWLLNLQTTRRHGS